MAVYSCDLHHFEQQLDSLISQSFEHWICLISDDGSSEAFQQQAAAFAKKDRRFIYHARDRNLGAYNNFEYGIEYFSEDPRITHLALADQDDIWRQDKLAKLLEAIEREGALLVHSDLELIDAAGDIIHPSVWQYERRQPEKSDPELLLLRNTVTGCTLMMRCSLIPSVLPFPRQCQAGCWQHDHWIALVAAYLGRIAHVREPLVRYRQHGNNLVGAEKSVGTIRNEFRLWIAKKGKITLKSYQIVRDLSQALYQRFPSDCGPKIQRCFPEEERIDLGFSILRLGVRSILANYGAQGTVLRLLLNKVVLDIVKIKKIVLEPFQNAGR